MPTNSDYPIHDGLYQKLKASSALGWGGENYSARMQGWDEVIKNMQTNPVFPSPPAKLLELGSGAGDLSLKFADLGYEVSGIEISETAVQWAREKAVSCGIKPQFHQGNVCDLQIFNDNIFDAVIDGNCYHCIIGSDRKLLLREVHRVLGDGGIFYLSTMFGNPKKLDSEIAFDLNTRCQIKSGVAYRYMGHKDDILKELSDAGFDLFDISTSSNPWWEHLTCLARKNN